MSNKAVVNEISEDDVNGLSDQIRQLKVFPQQQIKVATIYRHLLIVLSLAGRAHTNKIWRH